MKILKTPWKKEFIELIKNSKNNIRITSPFIKENICDEIISSKNEKSKINIITSFKLFNIYSGSLDINGLEKLINIKSVIKNFHLLHSKIYIFDEKYVIISSGNLTNGGLLNNYEYGILIDDTSFILKVIDDFETLFYNKDTGVIKESDINTVRNILSNISKTTNINLPNYSFEEFSETEIITTDVANIANCLSGWKKDVFIIANKIENQIFDLKEIYKYEAELLEIYPNNNNIKEKIRQQLQILRDLSLIEFLGNGKYKKLWFPK